MSIVLLDCVLLLLCMYLYMFFVDVVDCVFSIFFLIVFFNCCVLFMLIDVVDGCYFNHMLLYLIGTS